jgi:hypothetical protein
MDRLDQGKKARSSSLQGIITSWSLPNRTETRKTTETIEFTHHQQVEARTHPYLEEIYLSNRVEDIFDSKPNVQQIGSKEGTKRLELLDDSFQKRPPRVAELKLNTNKGP